MNETVLELPDVSHSVKHDAIRSVFLFVHSLPSLRLLSGVPQSRQLAFNLAAVVDNGHVPKVSDSRVCAPFKMRLLLRVCAARSGADDYSIICERRIIFKLLHLDR